VEQEFKVGDVVRVKTWEEMAEEFSHVTHYDFISVPFGYSRSMSRNYGDGVFKIKRVLEYKRETGSGIASNFSIRLQRTDSVDEIPINWSELMVEKYLIIEFDRLKDKFRPETEFRSDLI
jgi:hypothetical protein